MRQQLLSSNRLLLQEILKVGVQYCQYFYFLKKLSDCKKVGPHFFFNHCVAYTRHQRYLTLRLPVCDLCPGKGFRDAGFVIRTEDNHRANHPRVEGFGVRGERHLP